ncbi:MAG TPA: hypothetical protein VFJ19_01775 [Nocardioidaceae bacterium]|nr:hypothetical protein [Nocardioidaceae bacterium]
MADRVYLHVGLPKTGTTYLQTILWRNRDELRRQGVLLPGFGPRQHLWASGAVREDPHLDRRHPDAVHAWLALREAVNDWSGTAVISHEFFAGASVEQAARAVGELAGADVHVVVTARDTLGLVTARWQEVVKNGSTVAIDDFPSDEPADPLDEWDWGTMDLADVLARWGSAVAPDRVHVITVPSPSLPRETLWLRFAELVGIEASRCDTSGSEANESLGVVEVELLRRVNADLTGFDSPLNRGVWIRGYLAQGKLVPRRGEKFWPSPERVAELRERGERAVAFVAEQGYDVIGDLDDLRTPAELPARRHPSSVTDSEMLDAASATIAEMLTDVRRLTNEDRPRRLAARVRSRLPEPARQLARRARRLGGRVWRRS